MGCGNTADNKGEIMGKIKNLCMTQLVRMKKTKKPDMYTWVFSSVDNCYYNYNSKYLFEYVKEHLPQITPLFVINEENLRRELSEQYGKEYFIETESKEGIRRVLEAGVWFTSAGLPVYGTGLGKNRLIVNLWHGVPLKKIALMDPNMKKAARIYFKKIFSENYTWILTTSRELVPVMTKSFQVSEDRLRVWGQPRNDCIFAPPDRKQILEGIYSDLPEYKKVVLYAPTFRDYGNTRLFPFEDFDKKVFEDFLEQEKILLLLRLHIKEAAAADAYVSSRIRRFGSEEAGDVTGMLGMFDLLITDYSSIYIDYLLTDKPLMFLPYDRERYLDGRGMNFDYDEVTPGPKPETMKEFMMEIKEFMNGEDSWKKERDRVNLKFNEVKEPCSSNICNQVLLEIKKRTE
jgi:CDP-glycerol glycerophosphotransferase